MMFRRRRCIRNRLSAQISSHASGIIGLSNRSSRMVLAVAIAIAGLAAVVVGCSEERLESGNQPRSTSNCPADPPPFIEDDFPQPEFRHSKNGVLKTTLRAASEAVSLDGRPYVTQSYEGSVPGPTLVVCPEDRLVVNLQNDLREQTNLHTHGFHVSPQGNSDNVLLDIKPGERFTYNYDIPKDHAPGAYWYHPHYHRLTEEQVFAGMAGPIIIEGGLDELPGLKDVPQRILAIHTTQLGDNGRTVPAAKIDPRRSPLFVNGVINPEIDIQPGELQRWRIFNMNSDRFVKLRLEGQEFQLLAVDGNTLEQMKSVDEMLLGPGSRREVLVRGGTPGRYELEALPFTQFAGGGLPESTVATLVSGGKPADEERASVGSLENREDLRKVPVDRRRSIVYSEEVSADDARFLINGKEFDHNRVDQTMQLGDVEEWSIKNTTDEWHTFHIHINDFQVVEMDGKLVEGINIQDNVSLPPGSTVKMRTRFTDFTGTFVFHCHVLFHEDHGMMSLVEVVPSGDRSEDVDITSDDTSHEEAAGTEGTNGDDHGGAH
jgi:FtsP/CotA-like multicopper oxidase with cupredoxin domain